MKVSWDVLDTVQLSNLNQGFFLKTSSLKTYLHEHEKIFLKNFDSKQNFQEFQIWTNVSQSFYSTNKPKVRKNY